MRKVKYTVDRKSLETIHLSFILLVLEYADVIWYKCTQPEKYELEEIQLEAAWIGSGTTKLISTQNLFDETARDSLETRQTKQNLSEIQIQLTVLKIILIKAGYFFLSTSIQVTETCRYCIHGFVLAVTSSFFFQIRHWLVLLHCRSEEVENAENFFFRCYLRGTQRPELLNCFAAL